MVNHDVCQGVPRRAISALPRLLLRAEELANQKLVFDGREDVLLQLEDGERVSALKARNLLAD